MNFNFIFIKLRKRKFFSSKYVLVLIFLATEILMLNSWWRVVVSLIIGFQFSLCIAGNNNHKSWVGDGMLSLKQQTQQTDWEVCYNQRPSSLFLLPSFIAHWPLQWHWTFLQKEGIFTFFKILRKYELLPGLSLSIKKCVNIWKTFHWISD